VRFCVFAMLHMLVGRRSAFVKLERFSASLGTSGPNPPSKRPKKHIGHSDVGALVVALPMKQTPNPFCPTPTRVQLEQERKLDRVREHLLCILQNYASVEDEDEDKSIVTSEHED